MISIVANFSEKFRVLFFFLLLSVATANLSCLLETTFSSLRFLFNFTSLQSFESGQSGFLFSFSGVILNPQPFFPLFFCLSYLSERFFFVHDKAALARSRNQQQGCHRSVFTTQKNDFEHACGLRNSAYAVNLTYETYRHSLA